MEGSPLRIEALLQGMDGSGDAAAAAALGGVITGRRYGERSARLLGHVSSEA